MPLFSQTCEWKPKALSHILVVTRSLATKPFSIPERSLKADSIWQTWWNGTSWGKNKAKHAKAIEIAPAHKLKDGLLFVSAKYARLMRLQKHGLATQLGNAQTGHGILWPLCAIHFKWWQGGANSLPSLIFYRFLDGTSFSQQKNLSKASRQGCSWTLSSFLFPSLCSLCPSLCLYPSFP